MKGEHADLLDEGFHDMKMSDLRNHFLSGFGNSSRRKHLIDRFESFVRRFDDVGIERELWIGGSFTTSKQEPRDIDSVFFVDGAAVNQLGRDEKLELKHLFGEANKEAIEIRYECDAYLALRGNSEERERWKKQFGTYSDDRTPKGIARITSAQQ